MKKTIAIGVIFTLLMVSSAFADNIIGRHILSNDQGLVRVKSIEGSKMEMDIVYAPVRGDLVI
jgi:hypothetical protein